MNTLLKRLFLTVIIMLMLTACAEAKDQGKAETLRNLRASNLDSTLFPWTPGKANGRTKRWDVERDGLIPVKLNGSSLGQEAIQKIEAELGMALFETSSSAGLPDEMISRGIVVSEGTAVGPNGVVTRNTCGTVSGMPNKTDWPKNFYDADGRINTRLYVNLSSSKCSATLDIAIHEFGHALGLSKHFPGFGQGTAIAPSFWQALDTLYKNEVGTKAEDLKIEAPEE